MNETAESLRSQFQEERRKRGMGPSRSIDGGGGPPHDSDMEKLITRVDGLEKRFDRLETRLDGMDTRLRGVESSISAASAKLDVIVAKLPSWWQPPLSMAALLGFLATLLAVAKAIHLVG